MKKVPPARRLRVLVLMHHYLVPPENAASLDRESADWRTEFDVLSCLRRIGHDVRPLGVKDDLQVIRAARDEWQPHIAFNLLENFLEVGVFDQNVVSYLELLRLPYTGCNPRGLMLSRDKAIAKTLLAYHRVPIAPFAVFRIGQAVRRPKRLAFPLFVKSPTQDASIGISQASVVDDDAKLAERVRFIHEKIGTDALVERYIDGRELYVGLLGNFRVQAFPVWEMNFGDARPIATDRAKWSAKYQEKHGITTGPANLPPELAAQVVRTSKRVFRTLEMNGYARIDLRLTPEGRIYVIEANANPHIAEQEDFARAGLKTGLSYEALLQKIIQAGLRWRPERPG
jgi:D-alanine-D-alanine ligase